jgi:hypothetical protein
MVVAGFARPLATGARRTGETEIEMGTLEEIGVGRLSRTSAERHTDRYGLIWLAGDDNNEPVEMTVEPGRNGALLVEVIEDYGSRYYEDAAPVGATVQLGTGELFTEVAWSRGDVVATGVGVKPADGRETNWMDPMDLLRVHNQKVRVLFEPF